MNHILKDHRKRDDVSWKIDLLDERRISQKNRGGEINGIGKPLPWKQTSDEKQDIVLHLYLHNDLKGHEEYKGES